MRKKLVSLLFATVMMVALAVPFGGTASADDRVDGGAGNAGPSCHGEQVRNHVKVGRGGMKKAAEDHGLSVKENQEIIRADCP